jgi:diguanylate cyclase (GGDEF)-like protein
MSSALTRPETPAARLFHAEDHEEPTSPVLIIDPTLRDRGVLLETSGTFAGRPHTLPDETTIGRNADCTIRIDDEALSRHHARIVRAGRQYTIEDLGSLNGCYVSDRRVRRTVLQDGDRVRLGASVEMRFQLVTDDERRSLVRIYEAGLRDALTGLGNRKQLEEQLRAELSFARRHKTELCLVMADVDRFKAVNDVHGHLVGDAVLRHVASVIASTVRVEDVVARFGGEEFVVVARATGLEGGRDLAERLRAALEREQMRVGDAIMRVTASFGVATLACVDKPTMEALVGRADERLYAAKAQGRNRVVAI